MLDSLRKLMKVRDPWSLSITQVTVSWTSALSLSLTMMLRSPRMPLCSLLKDILELFQKIQTTTWLLSSIAAVLVFLRSSVTCSTLTMKERKNHQETSCSSSDALLLPSSTRSLLLLKLSSSSVKKERKRIEDKLASPWTLSSSRPRMQSLRLSLIAPIPLCSLKLLLNRSKQNRPPTLPPATCPQLSQLLSISSLPAHPRAMVL
mmetsp:Transcript_40804/g.29437  ORF Transcript_40804/g.29437 Transcript_40804/m.29437 type:complete len:205 (-) Transcript_40804:240-854(-)